MGQRIGIRELRYVADDATGIRRPRQGARGLSWNLLDGGTGPLEAQPFVRDEKEQFVLDDRTADNAAEIVLLHHASSLRRCVQKPAVGVQHVVAQALADIAMERIRGRAA